MSQITFNRTSVPQNRAADPALKDLTNRLLAESKPVSRTNVAPAVQHIRASKRELETENEQETKSSIPPAVRSELRNTSFINKVFQNSTVDAPIPTTIPNGFLSRASLAVYSSSVLNIRF